MSGLLAAEPPAERVVLKSNRCGENIEEIGVVVRNVPVAWGVRLGFNSLPGSQVRARGRELRLLPARHRNSTQCQESESISTAYESVL